MIDLTDLDVLMVIASNDFRDEEYLEPAEALARAKAGVAVASSSNEVAIGVNGHRVMPDLTLPEAKVADYAAVIFVGGAGSREFFDDPVAHRIAREAAEQGKFVCAICIAPSILANAGLLKGKEATCFPSERENLVAKGAKFVEQGVVRDGKIITADGPQSARLFGKAICDALTEGRPEEPPRELRPEDEGTYEER